MGTARTEGRDPPRSGGDVAAERVEMARALATLYFAGASIGAVSLLLPHPAGADDVALWINTGTAFIAAFGLFAGARWVPVWAIHVVLLIGSVLITRAVLLSGEPVSFYAVWYIWVGLYAFYFFPRLAAAAHVAAAAALYAATLVAHPAGSEVARWLTTVATLVVAGGFIDTLVRRARRQTEVAAASAAGLARFAAATHELARLSDPVATREALCRTALDVTGAAEVVLFELPPPAGGPHTATRTAWAGEAAALHAPDAVGNAGRALVSGRPIFGEFALWEPILGEDGPVGVLGLRWASAGRSRDGALRPHVLLVATEALITLNRLSLLARLAAMARTDELTGLPNRRAWEETLPRELERARRDGTPLCVVLIDLDHFKDYNDAHGHQAGDRLLKHASAAWRRELRATDVLARFGGDEFSLLLPRCDGAQALATVDRVRRATPDDAAGSAGIANWDGSESAFELLGRADAALYAAKREGRGRSVTSPVSS